MMFDLAFIWAGIIAFAILVYVVLDGFDLGIGILFPFMDSGNDKDVMMNTVAPVWDGNETWLILGGGGLFAVFPLAYAVALPALYMPLIIMLLGLIFRGVAFEYRWRTERWKGVWDVAFAGGSFAAALMQGIALGALVQGIKVADRAYAGGWWDWLTPFSIMTGLAVVVGYSLLGATWLVMKTEGELQIKMRAVSWYLGAATLAFVGVASLLTPLLHEAYFDHWFSYPAILYSMIVPILMIYVIWKLFTGLNDQREYSPFLASISIFVLCYIGIGISFFPYMVPPSLTIWDAAAPDSSLLFALVGGGVLLPIILTYTAFTYWVFRGKVKLDQGYH